MFRLFLSSLQFGRQNAANCKRRCRSASSIQSILRRHKGQAEPWSVAASATDLHVWETQTGRQTTEMSDPESTGATILLT